MDDLSQPKGIGGWLNGYWFAELYSTAEINQNLIAFLVSIPGTIIGIQYFRVSKRVRNTFVEPIIEPDLAAKVFS